MRRLAFCVMPEHFQLVVSPRQGRSVRLHAVVDDDPHTQRWHAARRSAGSGHPPSGAFRSFPVQDDAHVSTVCPYLERNALGRLGGAAEDWRRGGRWRRVARVRQEPEFGPWPFARPRNWVERVNEVQSPTEEGALRRAVRRGQPFGSPEWKSSTAHRLGLSSTLRPRWRPERSQQPAPDSLSTRQNTRPCFSGRQQFRPRSPRPAERPEGVPTAAGTGLTSHSAPESSRR
jgi:putative transposase